MNPSFSAHGGNLNEEARRLGIKVDQLLDASASLVPFPLPEPLLECLYAALKSNSLRSYPDCTHKALKDAIGCWHGIDPLMVLPGNGASELFTWAARDAAQQGLSGLPAPGFSDYWRALNCWNAAYLHLPIPLSWASETPQAFPLEPETDVIWITNPHNPTGQLWSQDSLKALLERNLLVICDEAFLPLVPNGEEQSLLPLVYKYPNLIVIRSLTKLFSLAGLRLGYAISSAERLERWKAWRDPWPVNGLALSAGTMLIRDVSSLKSWISKVQDWVALEGTWLQTNLKSIPTINPKHSSTNFLLIHSELSLINLRERLASEKILVRDCRSFINLNENWLRISTQTREGNIQIVNSIKKNLK